MSDPEQRVQVAIAMSPRDARRICSELAHSVDCFKEDRRNAVDRINRIAELAAADPNGPCGVECRQLREDARITEEMLVSLRNVGDQLDAFARSAGLVTYGPWWKLHR